jgi:hypothetical protein
VPSTFVKQVEDEFLKQFSAFAKACMSGAQWHEHTLARFVNEWRIIRSDDKTCFVCLRTNPRINLPCEHFTCVRCILIFGKRTDMWTYQLDHCFLCQEPTPGIFIDVKPPTHTYRVLSIDGGGVRAVIPLTFLLRLEREMGLGPVQNNFDLGVFSSSGLFFLMALRVLLTRLYVGTIAGLGLYINGWSVEVCIAEFERLAKFAFQPWYQEVFRLFSRLPFLQLFKLLPFLNVLSRLSTARYLSKLCGILISLATDSVYPSGNLDRALQEAYTTTKRILDYSPASAMGTYIGMTVSTMEPKTFIFTNYNRQDNRRDGPYGMLRGNVPVWEM